MIFHRRYQKLLPLYVYGEIRKDQMVLLENHLPQCAECRRELDELRKLHTFLAGSPLPEPDDDLLREARRQLAESLAMERGRGVGESVPGSSGESRRREFGEIVRGLFGGILIPRPVLALGSLALLALGIAAGRILFPPHSGPRTDSPVLSSTDPVRITNMQLSGTEGQEVELTFDTVRPVRLKGRIENPEIQKVLAYAVVNSDNPGVRLRAVGSVTSRPATQDREMKAALLLALRTDQNDGVRKEALRALLRWPADREVRDALLYVLLNDNNPGLRIAAVNGLDTLRARGILPDEELLQTFREKLQHDDNLYIRTKAQTIIGVKQQ
jgi:hypothetical protein